MPITAQHVRETLAAYLTEHPNEADRLSAITATLDQAGDGIASRKEFLGHVTTGAILLRPDSRVLMIKHRALGKWLLPGGHAEPADATLLAAALRELTEETGIAAGQVEPVGAVPLDIDVHPIPANPAKGEPAHQHFDFRFLFRTAAETVELQEEEVTGYSWRHVEMLTGEPLRSRVMAVAAVAV